MCGGKTPKRFHFYTHLFYFGNLRNNDGWHVLFSRICHPFVV